MWCKFWQCRGAIVPVLKKPEMTQEVGVGQDGRLWTEPTTGTALNPVAKTADMTNPVGVDGNGELWCEPVSTLDQQTGTGDLYDSISEQNVGTYDYVITGKTMTVQIHVPATWTSTCVGVSMTGLPAGVTFSMQDTVACYVADRVSTPALTVVGVRFHLGVVSAYTTGEFHGATTLPLIDGCVFTIKLS